MQLKPLTEGKISGTGNVELGAYEGGGKLGGVLISTNGTNAATVVIRKNNSLGQVLFDMATITAQMVVCPVDIGNAATLYYSITGTGASAMLYEWVH